jgi:hypothetical protein
MIITIPAPVPTTVAESDLSLGEYLTRELKRYFPIVYGVDYDDQEQIIASVGYRDDRDDVTLVHSHGSDDDWFTFVQTDE